MVANRLAAAPQVCQAVQGALVRVAGPVHQEDRVGARRGREAAPPGQAHAHPVEDHRPNRRQDRRSVPRALRVPPRPGT